MENNNFISNNPFEFNIQLPKKTLSEVQKVVQKEVGNISINPIMDYLDKNNKVFSGEVAEEIRMYQAQIYSLGQFAREGQPITTFSVKI